jgi:hypothetical protein
MIHISKYNWEYTRESIIEKVYKNKLIKKDLSGNNSVNTDELMFYCEEFSSIKKFVIKEISKIENKRITDYAFSMWSYIQTNKSKIEFFHNHLLVDGGRTDILTDYTFVFYLKIPDGLVNDEGNLLLKIDNEIKSIKPIEGDIIFFPGNMLHVPKLTPSTNSERIAIAGNVSINFLVNKKTIIRYKKIFLQKMTVRRL